MAAAKGKGPAAPPAAPGGGILRRLLGCCRRRSAKDAAPGQRYKDILAVAGNVPKKKKDWYDKLCWWSDVRTKQGARIFVLAPRGPKGELETWIHMWELFSYAVGKMHEFVVDQDSRFTLVWVQMSDHRTWPCSLYEFKDSLHERFHKNLEAIHVVHPSWSVRLLRLALWPIADDEFWEHFHSHERIEFVDQYINLREFIFPKDIIEYDKWLDKNAQEMQDQAKGRFGGGLGKMAQSEEDDRKAKEHSEQLQKLLGGKGPKRE